MKALNGKRILLGVSGGIAAYKTPEIVRLIVKNGGAVKVVLTDSGSKFVAQTSLETVSGNRVYTDLFPKDGNYDPLHISLARWADAILVAPATANIIGKTANGIADDLLSTILIASDVPVFMSPSMNTMMYNHPAVQKNLETLNKRGISIIDPETGVLASKSEGSGIGRMPEPQSLVEWLNDELDESAGFLEGKKVLVTAGPTVEELDPVRYLSNHSSGKMGFSIAREAVRQGAEVVLVHGPVSLKPPRGLKSVLAKSADAMLKAVQQEFPDTDIAIMTAAVADYKPSVRSTEKMKKQDKLTLELVRNPDILAWMGEKRSKQFIVGFALEDDFNIGEAKKKLSAKNADLIVLNTIDAMHSEACKAVLVSENFEEELSDMSKEKLARELIDKIARLI